MSAHDRPQACLDPICPDTIDPRIAANITLGGMIAALLASSLMAIGAPPTAYLQDAKIVVSDLAASPAKPVRVVGMTAPQDLACEKQAWPYIHQSCRRSDAKPRNEARPRAVGESSTRDGADLSPLTATGSVVVPQQAR